MVGSHHAIRHGQAHKVAKIDVSFRVKKLALKTIRAGVSRSVPTLAEYLLD
jgi:hypothetical protein